MRRLILPIVLTILLLGQLPWTAMRGYAQAAMPVFVAMGTAGTGTGDNSPTLPAGLMADHGMLLFCETATEDIPTPSGWTDVGVQAATASRLEIWQTLATGSDVAPTITDPGDHAICIIGAYSGVETESSFVDVTVGSVTSSGATSESIPGTTTTVANTLIVVAATNAVDVSNSFSSITNANLANLTERSDTWNTAGNGGGLVTGTGEWTTVGNYGSTTGTWAQSGNSHARISVALKGAAPIEEPPPTGEIAFDTWTSSTGQTGAAKATDVDDLPASPDDATTYSFRQTSNGAQCFSFTPLVLTNPDSITSVTLVVRHAEAEAADSTTLVPGLRVGTTVFETGASPASVVPTTAWTTTSFVWALNPATGEAWTESEVEVDLNGLCVNATDMASGDEVRVTQVYATAQVVQDTTVYTHYVSSNGSSVTDCSSAAAPCTLARAMAVVPCGSIVNVADGRYSQAAITYTRICAAGTYVKFKGQGAAKITGVRQQLDVEACSLLSGTLYTYECVWDESVDYGTGAFTPRTVTPYNPTAWVPIHVDERAPPYDTPSDNQFYITKPLPYSAMPSLSWIETNHHSILVCPTTSAACPTADRIYLHTTDDGPPSAADDLWVTASGWGRIIVQGDGLWLENLDFYASGSAQIGAIRVEGTADHTEIHNSRLVAVQFWSEGTNTLVEDTSVSHVISQGAQNPCNAYNTNPSLTQAGSCWFEAGSGQAFFMEHGYNQIARRVRLTQNWNTGGISHSCGIDLNCLDTDDTDNPNILEQSVIWGTPNHGLGGHGYNFIIQDNVMMNVQDILYYERNNFGSIIVRRNTFKNSHFYYVGNNTLCNAGGYSGHPTLDCAGGTNIQYTNNIAVGAGWDAKTWELNAEDTLNCNLYIDDGDLIRVHQLNGTIPSRTLALDGNLSLAELQAGANVLTGFDSPPQDSDSQQIDLDKWTDGTEFTDFDEALDPSFNLDPIGGSTIATMSAGACGQVGARLGAVDLGASVIPSNNTPPTTNAGADQTVELTGTITLTGSYTDDGLPAGGTVTYQWSEVSGSGTVTFGTATAAQTTATFSASDTYVINLRVSDGELFDDDTVSIVVADPQVNSAPVVDANGILGVGVVIHVRITESASLAPIATDDGLVMPLTFLWSTLSKPSGAADATFASSTSLFTTATFNKIGTYVLRITIDDSGLTDADEVTVVVHPRARNKISRLKIG